MTFLEYKLISEGGNDILNIREVGTAVVWRVRWPARGRAAGCYVNYFICASEFEWQNGSVLFKRLSSVRFFLSIKFSFCNLNFLYPELKFLEYCVYTFMEFFIHNLVTSPTNFSNIGRQHFEFCGISSHLRILVL